MILSDEQRKDFEEAARPLMVFLSNPKIFNPYTKATVTYTKAELSNGVCIFNTDDYVVD